MGKKYIITESQEKILTRLVELELGPEESVLVVNKNPFKYEEFKDARKPYSSSLKDGERFYQLDIDGVLGTLNYDLFEKLKSTIDGKTIRAGDRVYDIKVSRITTGLQDSRGAYPTTDVEVDFLPGFGNYKFNIGTTINYKQYISGFRPILELIEKSILDINSSFKIEDVNDDYFEIREIQRKKTDF